MRELEEIWAEAFRERYNEGPKRVTMLFGEKVREECKREVEDWRTKGQSEPMVMGEKDG